jgi:hypothetical protein
MCVLSGRPVGVGKNEDSGKIQRMKSLSTSRRRWQVHRCAAMHNASRVPVRQALKIVGFFRSTVADARFQAVFSHQDGASFAITVQQRRPGDISAEPAPVVF